MGQDDAGLIDRFLEMMAAERGAARNTLLAYRADLNGAGEMMGGLAGASAEAIGTLAPAWATLAASSVARKVSALRAFYGFLEEEGLRADNPSAALPRPVTRRPLPKMLRAQSAVNDVARAGWLEKRGKVSPSWRKPVGMLAIIALIALWAVLVGSLSGWIGSLPVWAQVPVYVVLGIVWIWLLPLRRLLAWMETGRWHRG